jgi:N-methylhydantoinase B
MDDLGLDRLDELATGGTGARPHGDGVIAAFPGNMSATPIEPLEASVPGAFRGQGAGPGLGRRR